MQVREFRASRAPARALVKGLAPFLPGDDGSPVTSNELLIDLVCDGIETPALSRN